MNSTKLGYYGKVELIKKSKKGTVISVHKGKNQGTEKLFELFAKALVGSYDNRYVPTNVVVYNKKDSIVIQSSPISGMVYVSTSDYIHDPHVKLTAYIPFNSGYGTDDSKLELKLMSNENELANFSLSGSGIGTLVDGQSFIMNWYLYITNYKSGSYRGVINYG